MARTETAVSNLKLNRLTRAQYDTALSNNEINDNELYFITDERYLTETELEGRLSNVAVIDDNSNAPDRTWSAEKLSQALSGAGGNYLVADGQVSMDYSIFQKKDTTTSMSAIGIILHDSGIGLPISVPDTSLLFAKVKDDGSGMDAHYISIGTNYLQMDGSNLLSVANIESEVLSSYNVGNFVNNVGYIGTSGGTITGVLKASKLIVPATTSDDASITWQNSEHIQFNFKDSNGAEWPAMLYVQGQTGDLEYYAQGGFNAGSHVIATQSWVNSKLSSVYKYQGSVDTYNDLPSAAENGWVYNVRNTGANYAWTGTEWDELGATINTDNLATKNDISTVNASITTLQDKLVNGTDNFIVRFADVANSATRASEDANGNAIDTTYVKKSELKGGTAVTIDSSGSAVQGTLTDAQMATLQNSDTNYILFNNEIYRLQDKGHVEGYLTYVHNGYENNDSFIKSITITVNTKTWVLNTTTVASKDYVDTQIGNINTGAVIDDTATSTTKTWSSSKISEEIPDIVYSETTPTAPTEGMIWLKNAESAGGGTIDIDPTPTENSNNAVSSGGVYSAIAALNIPTKTSQLQNDSNFITEHQSLAAYATIEYVDNKVSSVYRYRSSVANYDALPSTGNTIGDVYNTEDTGMNYAWNGTSWDALGSTVNLSAYATKNDVQSSIEAAIGTLNTALENRLNGN